MSNDLRSARGAFIILNISSLTRVPIARQDAYIVSDLSYVTRDITAPICIHDDQEYDTGSDLIMPSADTRARSPHDRRNCVSISSFPSRPHPMPHASPFPAGNALRKFQFWLASFYKLYVPVYAPASVRVCPYTCRNYPPSGRLKPGELRKIDVRPGSRTLTGATPNFRDDAASRAYKRTADSAPRARFSQYRPAENNACAMRGGRRCVILARVYRAFSACGRNTSESRTGPHPYRTFRKSERQREAKERIRQRAKRGGVRRVASLPTHSPTHRPLADNARTHIQINVYTETDSRAGKPLAARANGTVGSL